jgi:hypothetical protein
VWNDISKELTQKFLSGGQCNQDARAAIRLIFHDCGGELHTLALDGTKLMRDSMEFGSRGKGWL